MKNNYSAIVVGGGHAGVEAAFAIANKGFDVALVTLDISRVAMMPCNPSIGGPAKGNITREIDALGGVQAYYADKAMIQIKMLNNSKGPAVRALRAQIDKEQYSADILKDLKEHKNITLIAGVVVELLTTNNVITGIKLKNGDVLTSTKVILTTGTYLDSTILLGAERTKLGPDGQETTTKLSESMVALGIELQRLKTGTSPRVLTSSIDFSKVEKEIIELNDFSFSSHSNVKLSEQISCYLTYTTEATHDVIREHIEETASRAGAPIGVAPRYCPSIEDKVIRFSDKDRHQIFYEPETREGDIIYVNGFATSMPVYVQKKLIKTLPGMENAVVTKWAYAIAYDAINPLQLKHSLEIKKVPGLYCAGQINGTSGYEEAAGQGLIAGINVALALENKNPLVLTRDISYIGVLIDDLVIKGTKEPYRMLTSRAEYRLLLRNDNADQRLAQIGYELGLVSKETAETVKAKYKLISDTIEKFSTIFISPKDEIGKKYKLTHGVSIKQLISRPEVDINDFKEHCEFIYELSIQVKLAGYIKKQETMAKKMKKLEGFKIPKDIDYDTVSNLATEAKQKLKVVLPETIGQMGRVAGINPADVQMLMFHIEKRNKNNED